MRIGFLVMVMALAGCAGLRPSEQAMVAELQKMGANPEAHGTRSPTTAAWLCLLPAGGDFYNGAESGLLTLDLLTWPVSILWAPKAAMAYAHVLNQRDTVDYYRNTEAGRAMLEGLRAGRIDPKTLSPVRVGAPDPSP